MKIEIKQNHNTVRAAEKKKSLEAEVEENRGLPPSNEY